MTCEKEELKAAAMTEVAGMVQAAISSSAHRRTLTHGEIAALQSMAAWYDGYLKQINNDLAEGKIDDSEATIAKTYLTKVGEQLTHRAAACALELRHLEGEVRGYQGFGNALGKRLEMSQAKIDRAQQESEDIEARRQANTEGDDTDVGNV